MKVQEIKLKSRYFNFYIQYSFYHFGILLDYYEDARYYNFGLALPFVVLSIQVPTNKCR